MAEPDDDKSRHATIMRQLNATFASARHRRRGWMADPMFRRTHDWKPHRDTVLSVCRHCGIIRLIQESGVYSTCQARNPEHPGWDR